MATDFDSLFQQAGQRFNVSPALLRAVSGAESGGNFDTQDSPAGAFGGMQIMPATYQAVAQRYGLSGDPRDPANNIAAGAAVLSENLDRYGNVPDALRAYNGGTDPSKWANPETAAYVGRVAKFYQPDAPASPDPTANSAPSNPPGSYQVASADTGTRSDAMPDPSAPPSPSGAASRAASPAAFSDDDLHALLTGASINKPAPEPSASSSSPWGDSPAPSSPSSTAAPSSAPAPLSDDALHSMLTGGAGTQKPPAPVTANPAGQASAPTGAVPTEPAASPSAGLPQTGFLGGLTTVGEGLANAGNRLSAYVDRNVPALGAVDRAALPVLGMDQPDQVANRLTPDIAQRDQANAGSLSYGAGKLAGDVAATAPIAATGGALVGGALEAAPVVGNALGAVSDAARAVPMVGGTVARMAPGAVSGAAQGATAAAVTSGQSDDPIVQQLKQGAFLGAGLGAVTPSLINAGRSVWNAVRGGSISPETAQLADLARNTYGIPLTAAQISESPTVKFAASAAGKVPFSGSTGDAAEAQTAFNRAVSQSFGEDAGRITPAVMQAARTRIGDQFDQIAGHDFQADHQLVSDLAGIESHAQQVLPATEWQPIRSQLDNVLGAVDQNGRISGDAYQVLTRQGAPLDRAQSGSDPNVSYYAGQVRDALDNALARGIPPDQQAALATARSQWKALKTVEPLVGKSTIGNISPPALMTPVKSSYGNIAYTGGGPLGDLARIGQMMKEPPSSGSAERGSAILALRDLGTAAAGTLAGVTHPIDAAAVGGSVLGTAGLARGVNAYLNSQSVANRLVSRGLAGNPGPGPISNALAAGVLPAGVVMGQQQPRNRLTGP